MPKEFTVDRPIEQMNEQDRVNDVRNRYFSAYNFWRNEKCNQEENGQFTRGIQWSGDQADYLKQQHRDILVWNKVIGHIKTAVGTMQMNKFDSVAKPLHSEDESRAAVMNYILQYHKQNSDLDFLEPAVFEKASIFNYGVYELRLVPGRDYRTDVKVFSADPLHIYRDPNSYEDNLSDCDYIIRDAWMTKEQLKRRFPKKKNEIEKMIFTTELYDDQIENSQENDLLIDQTRRNLYVDISGRNVKVIEYWHFTYEDKPLLYNSKTDRIYYPPDKATNENIQKFLHNYPHLEVFRRREKKLNLRTVAYNTLLYDTVDIDEPYPVQTGNLPFIFNWWYKINRDTFSLAEILKDPQREINKRRTTMLLALAKAVRGGYLAEENSIDIEQWKENPEIRFVKGSLNRVRENDRSKMDLGFFQYDKMMQDDLDDQGMPRASRGQSEFSNESGRQTNIKITQANIKLLGPMNYHRLAKKLYHEELLRYTQQLYKDERQLRILGEDGKAMFFDINTQPDNDITQGEYDVFIDEASASASAKEYYASVLTTMFQTMIQGGFPAQALPFDLVAESIDHPKRNEIVDAIRNAMQKVGMVPSGGVSMPAAMTGSQGGQASAQSRQTGGPGVNMTPPPSPQQFALTGTGK